MADKILNVNPSPEWRMPGQRKHDRVDVTAKLLFAQIAAGERMQEWLEGQVMDISAGGLMFCARHKLSVGARMELKISLAEILANDVEADPEELAGKIDLVTTAEVRQRMERMDGSFLYGTRFLSIRQGDIAGLTAFIEKYA